MPSPPPSRRHVLEYLPLILWGITVVFVAGGTTWSHHALTDDVAELRADFAAHQADPAHPHAQTDLALHAARIDTLERRSEANTMEVQRATTALIKIEARLDAICRALGPSCHGPERNP